MERRWSMRAHREGDEEGILELWKAVYPEKEYDPEKWLRWWRWLYKDNPAGGGRIWLAEHDGKIVGQYTIVPVKMKNGNKAVLGSQGLNLMTHPDYRRQKMFETLARKVYDEAEEDGLHIGYAFLNKFSCPGFVKKLNWFDIGIMQPMAKPLNWRNAVKLKIKSRFLQRVLAMGASLLVNKVFFRTSKPPDMEGLTINQITSFDDRINALWAKVSTQHQIMVVRSKDYLNWRYGTPEVNYSIFAAEKAGEISGYLILEHKILGEIKVSIIFDTVAQSEEVMHCLVSKAVEDCQQKKAALILYSLIANKSYRRVLRKNGFISLPFLKGSRFCAYSSSPSIPKNFLKYSGNWLVQIGDSDAV
ncbi:GNAT family N-acetyltransferase [Chloroflexota bacterium]